MDELKRFDPFLKPASSRAADAKRLRLMVIDDDRALREALKDALAPPYEVVCRPQGEDSIRELAERQPGLLILDIGVPGETGAELRRKIHAHPRLHGLPILCMTARPGDDAGAAGLGAGSDYFIAKPFELSALRDRIATLLDGQLSPN